MQKIVFRIRTVYVKLYFDFRDEWIPHVRLRNGRSGLQVASLGAIQTSVPE